MSGVFSTVQENTRNITAYGPNAEEAEVAKKYSGKLRNAETS